MVPGDDCFSCFSGVLDSFTQSSLMKNIGENKQTNQGVFSRYVLVNNFGLSPVLQY